MGQCLSRSCFHGNKIQSVLQIRGSIPAFLSSPLCQKGQAWEGGREACPKWDMQTPLTVTNRHFYACTEGRRQRERGGGKGKVDRKKQKNWNGGKIGAHPDWTVGAKRKGKARGQGKEGECHTHTAWEGHRESNQPDGEGNGKGHNSQGGKREKGVLRGVSPVLFLRILKFSSPN